jgi:threonylcarbamoyladenosine tRNA methylthiotransferase MtaB
VAKISSIFHIETHGCKLNQADSQVIAQRLINAGYQLTDDAWKADIHIVNTCTVTHAADRKARHALRNARRHKPNALVVATGCYAQRAPREVASIDGVDLVLGNTQKDDLINHVVSKIGFEKPESLTGKLTSLHKVASLKTRAMVKIQEGCDQICAYCIVPKVRGREHSIHPDRLVTQIQRLTDSGVHEVVLTGTQLGTYGFDIPDISLASLVNRILQQTSIRRLRISSLQPQEISEELLQLWDNPRLCPHFHIPLQSGSSAILKAMRRRYSPMEYTKAVQSIRQMMPHAAITTDVIVGFPGETENQFQETLNFCKDIRYSSLHIFPYSTRPGTSAAHFEPKVEDSEKRIRMEIMLRLAEEQAKSYRRNILGTTCEVLWETNRHVNDVQRWSGLTKNYVRVVTLASQMLYNQITPVLLEEQDGELVWARIL